MLVQAYGNGGSRPSRAPATQKWCASHCRAREAVPGLQPCGIGLSGVCDGPMRTSCMYVSVKPGQARALFQGV